MKKIEFAIRHLESNFEEYKSKIRSQPNYVISEDEQLGLVIGYQDAIRDLKRLLNETE